MMHLVRHVLSHARFWLLLVAGVTVFLAAGFLRLELRTDGQTLRPRHDPLVVQSEIDGARFQDPRQLVVLVSTGANGPPVASPAGLRFLRSINKELRALPAVRATAILSLPGLPKPAKDSAGFSLGSYLDEIPEEPAAFARLLGEIRSHRLTDGLLLSTDGNHAAFYVPLVQKRPVPELVAELEEWQSAHEGSNFEIRLSGPEMAEATLGRMVLRDLMVLVPVMLVLIMSLLFVVFRNPGGVLVPMAESLVVLIWTFGAMGWLGVPVTLVTTILPVVLMAMSITDELHLLERVEGCLRGEPDSLVPDGPKPSVSTSLPVAVETALAEVGRPIVATSVTTALGFLSFLSATMAPIRQFGVFTAFGILAAMVLSFIWIPALIVSLPDGWFEPRQKMNGPASRDRLGWLGALGRWSTARPGLAFGVAVLAVALAAPGISRLEVQDAWVENFAPDSPLVTAERAYNDSFWGSYRFDVVFEGSHEFFYTPAGAALMEDVRRIAREAPHVGGALTYLSTLEEVARALGKTESLSSLSPLMLADVATVAEMSESRLRLRQLLTDRGERARMRLFVKDADYRRAEELWSFLERRLPAVADSYGVAYHFSGDLPVALTVVDSIVGNQMRSIAWALVTVGLALLVFFSRGKGALVSMVPVIAAVVMVLGGMGYAGMPLGIAASMFAALTVGVGVDFGVHLLHRYRHERSAGREHGEALQSTVEKTGRALSWNTFVLACGFLVLGLSALRPNQSLGLLLATAILVCYSGTLMLLPRLLRLLGPAALLALICLPGPVEAVAALDDRCAVEEDIAARALIAKIESDFRSDARISRMAIATYYGKSHPLHRHFKDEAYEKVLWSIVNGDPEETWLLYTFSAPGRLAGTSLLVQDFADLTPADSMWLYLRSFDTFTKLDPGAQRVMVPGTALTYQDSRGFIPLDRYRFSFDASGKVKASEGEVVLLGCPRSETIRENLGYDSITLVVDKSKSIVRRVYFRDLGGKPLKRYELIRETAFDERWFQAEVKMEHHADDYSTTINYEHWPAKETPPQSMFRPEVAEEKFLTRLQAVLEKAGLGERIGTEIEAANARIREYDEKMGRVPETKKPAAED